MPAHDYPFIEIAVHPSIRERYSEGAGLAVLSPTVDYVYWANGAAATQFGYESIYTFLEDEAFEEGLLARQVETAAGRVAASGQAEKLILRVGSGFRRVATPCVLEPMTLSIAAEFLMRKYEDQPLKYFNTDRKIWIINCTTGTIKPASLTFEL